MLDRLHESIPNEIEDITAEEIWGGEGPLDDHEYSSDGSGDSVEAPSFKVEEQKVDIPIKKAKSTKETIDEILKSVSEKDLSKELKVVWTSDNKEKAKSLFMTTDISKNASIITRDTSLMDDQGLQNDFSFILEYQKDCA